MNGRAGLVIALSGIESAGKTTQRDALTSQLRRRGQTPISVWIRAGYTPRLKLAKRMLRALRRRGRRERQGISDRPGQYPRRAANLKRGLQRWFWLTVAMLDLVWMYGIEVRLWRARGRTVICDRYLLDCLVDFCVNFPDDRVERRWLCRLLRRLAVQPDAAFCLLIPAEQSLQRSRVRSRYNWETLDVLQQRCDEYRALGTELGVEILDGNQPAASLAETLQSKLEGLPARHVQT